MFKKTPIHRNYISPIDEALAQFDQNHTPSPAQQAEIDKYRRIYQMRDHAIPPKKDKDLWDLENQ